MIAFIAMFLLGVLLGWLLSPRGEQCPAVNDGNGRVTGSGASAKGAGTPGKLGAGGGTSVSAGGSGHASGDVKSGGGASDAGNGEGADAGGGGGGGGKTEGGSGDGAPTPAAEAALSNSVVKLAAGSTPLGQAVSDETPAQVTGKVLTAPDFTYDKTGLPRYQGSVQHVVSALSYKNAANTNDYGSSVAIQTGDSFDAVVAWYRGHLQPGWHDQTSGDLGRLAQQLSVENLTRVLSGAGSQAPPPPSGDPLQVSIFTPPAGSAGEPGVMIVKRGDQPVTVMMKAHSGSRS